MRFVVASMLVVSLLLLPVAGCGGRPDPREREDFIDTTDPSSVVDQMDAPAPGGPAEQPAEKPKPPE